MADPARVGDGQVATLAALLERSAAIRGDAPFATFPGGSLTFHEIFQKARQVAAQVVRRGIRPGDRVALMVDNGPDAVALVFGLALAGAVWVPVNVNLRGHGLDYVLTHSEPSLILLDEKYREAVRPQERPDMIPMLDTRRFVEEAAGLAGDTIPLEPVGLDDPFAIMYTSGTTGPPKGVIVTHRMFAYCGEGVTHVSVPQPGDVFYIWEPLFHIGGAQMLVVPFLRDVSIHIAERFSASRFWDEVRACGATHIHYLGGILDILLKATPSPKEREHAVRIAWGAGCRAEAWREIESRFGLTIRECYGMTEASSITTYNADGTVGNLGREVPWLEVRLAGIDAADRPGGRGEILVRGREPGIITPGYFNNEEASRAALRDGWLHTGDVGSFDAEGRLRFHGRTKDSLRVRGENVSAWELEHVVSSHPGVAECAVIGVAADIGEQEIKLFVRPAPHGAPDPQDLLGWLDGKVASYQMPRFIAFVSDFDRTPSQRIMKHRLPASTAGCWDRLAEAPGKHQ